MNPQKQSLETIFTIGCITFLSGLAMVLGFELLHWGYQSGEILVTSGGVAGLSGLIGYLGGKAHGQYLASQAQNTMPQASVAPPAPLVP